MDDRGGRIVPAQKFPLHRHRVHHPCHRDGPLHRRKRPAALRRSAASERRRPGPPLQCGGQTFDREDGGHLPRCVPDGERHHGQRVQIPAGQGGGRCDPQRLRQRLRVDGCGVRPASRRRPPCDDRRGGGLSGAEVRAGAPDRGNQRPLRVSQQGARRLSGFAQGARGVGPARTRCAGLYHRAGGQQRPPRRFAGPSARPVAAGRCGAAPLCDPLPRKPGRRSHRACGRRERARQGGIEGARDLRSDLPERYGRHLRQDLLRAAGGHGRDGFRLLLRTVGIYAVGIGGFFGADHHHDARGIRAVGEQARSPSGRGGDSPRRLQRRRGRRADRRRTAALRPAGGKAGRRSAPLGL